MADEPVKALLIEQATTIELLSNVWVNYKKKGKEQITPTKTRNRIELLENYWKQCQRTHCKLIQLVKEEEREEHDYFVNKDFYNAEDAYQEVRDTLHELLVSRVSSPLQDEAGGSSSNTSFHTPSAPSVPMPRISLPIFSGNPTEWEAFYDMFISLVVKNESLTNTQRFHYLKSSLQGEASALINHIRVTDANYDGAWKILEDEFQNPRLLVHSYIQSFMELPVMKNENVQELKQLRDTVSSSISALTNLKRPVEQWGDLLVYIMTQKFSPRTRNEWNLKLGASTAAPTYKELQDFLNTRIRGLPKGPHDLVKLAPNASKHPRSNASIHNVTVEKKCQLCQGNHNLGRCTRFRQQNVERRHETVRKFQLCFNCLNSGHIPRNCPSQHRCNQCNKCHHTLLHRDVIRNVANHNEAPSLRNSGNPTSTASQLHHSSHSSTRLESNTREKQTINDPNVMLSGIGLPDQSTVHAAVIRPAAVLLPTVWVSLRTPEGRYFQVRALLDQGSVFSFVSESLAQTMHTKRYPANLQITGFGEQFSGSVKSQVHLTLAPCQGHGPQIPMTAYVFQKITAYAASKVRPLGLWPHLKDIQLADPFPDSKEPIHLLIGADLYGGLLRNDLRQGPLGSPTGQLTIFGWIISGPVNDPSMHQEIPPPLVHSVHTVNVHELLQRFWEVEEVPSAPHLSEEDKQCEDHFLLTHSRDADGKYVVRLPFRHGSPPDIGNSYFIASKFYQKLEQRLHKNNTVALEYNNFLEEYVSLQHMERVFPSDTSHTPLVYIPHHPVIKDSSLTTRLRVVFNASSVTTNGTSLNDHLLVGPKLQGDLPSVIMRWRQGLFAYSADITKMFRQIWVHPDDLDYQRILWRPSAEEPVQSYRLRTVTYGTAPAPYLAMRVLQQLAIDEGYDLPDAVKILRESIYVDDALFSSDDIPSILASRDQVNKLLSRGGFHLRKWASNCDELLRDIPKGDHELALGHSLNDSESLKVLGLTWLPKEDAFQFKVSPPPSGNHTKRTVLSFIAKLYDPLGWAGPVVITAKILMQDLWLRGTDWDKPIPKDLLPLWTNYCAHLPDLEKLRIPRWTGHHRENLGVELHGFADASNRAYSAVVYLRILQDPNNIRVSLIAGKTKVAPVKVLSIPRLELCGVVLVAKLLQSVQKELHLQHAPIFGWTDSSVVLAWMNQHPTKWTTFVANRVSEVQTKLPNAKWNHVSSSFNPADCASRGLSPHELIDHSLWWSGPEWLSQPPACWPRSNVSLVVKPVNKDIILSESRPAAVTHVQNVPEWDLPLRVSTWPRLIRVTAYLMRFIHFLCDRRSGRTPNFGPLVAQDLHLASLFWLRYLQLNSFSSELRTLSNGQSVSNTSVLSKLNPFIGEDTLIRVGGRLRLSSLTYDERHPIILPRHRVTELMIAQAHTRTLHGGTQLTLRVLRQKFWVLGARTSVKSCIQRCIPCVRERGKTSIQLMGDLPPQRVNPSAPFTHAGLDYAGPLSVTPYVGRGCKSRKYYIAIFVCMCTKAVHLEYVDDYAASGFLGAYKRFVARRGVPTDLYSDNGTTFQGADRELRQCFQSAIQTSSFHHLLANDATNWHFIPPASPHFGGLWEAGVKSLKHHLKRVVGNHTLSQLELSTLLCQIEACLNSRPLVALNDDPSDLTALTPGHFLIGRPLISVPEPTPLDVPFNRLSRWQTVVAMRDRIWRCWQHDYLQTLHSRNKWQKVQPEVQVNDLVLLKNNLLPPSKWELARIVAVQPGADGLVRVVTVKTSKSILKRSIAQICRLPIETT